MNGTLSDDISKLTLFFSSEAERKLPATFVTYYATSDCTAQLVWVHVSQPLGPGNNYTGPREINFTLNNTGCFKKSFTTYIYIYM
jgi:hypothetical protein